MAEFITQYWLGIVFTGIAGLISTSFCYIIKLFKKDKQEHITIRNGIQALLRDRIIQAYNHYKDKNNCPIYALENIEKMYNEYKSLGGNGTIQQLVGELRELPHN